MLLRTLKIAAPNVFRFIVCTGVLYSAVLLCGWLVMGPYHPKVYLIHLYYRSAYIKEIDLRGIYMNNIISAIRAQNL